MWMSRKDFTVYAALALNLSYSVLEVVHFFYNKPTREEFPMGTFTQVTFHFAGLLHNEDGPSSWKWYGDTLEATTYHFQGQLHRNNGLPADIEKAKNPMGVPGVRKKWFVHGQLIRGQWSPDSF